MGRAQVISNTILSLAIIIAAALIYLGLDELATAQRLSAEMQAELRALEAPAVRRGDNPEVWDMRLRGQTVEITGASHQKMTFCRDGRFFSQDLLQAGGKDRSFAGRWEMIWWGAPYLRLMTTIFPAHLRDGIKGELPIYLAVRAGKSERDAAFRFDTAAGEEAVVVVSGEPTPCD